LVTQGTVESVDRMLEGFPDLDKYVAEQRLGFRQRATLISHVLAVAAYRRWLRATGGEARAESRLQAEQATRVGLELRARPRTAPRPAGGHYLSDGDIRQFEREGLLGPFRVMPREDAKELAADVRRSADDFVQNCYLGARVVESLKRHDAWKFEYSGLHQALRHRGLWNLATCAPIAHRMADLLGDDVLCWRSQLFGRRRRARPARSGTRTPFSARAPRRRSSTRPRPSTPG
jgi:non-haem Fe2+, alpha-ketoglutarate-dependent halogenase